MELLKKLAAPAFGALALSLAIFLLKSAPSSKLWKGYTTLSVPAAADEKAVNGVLSEGGCGDYIALESQEQVFFGGYESARLKYFYDKNKGYKIYYIPDSNARGAQTAARILQSRLHIDAVLGSRAAFPYVAPLVCVLVFAAFFAFAENKAVFAAASAPALFFAFCNPFYAAAAAVCLELYAFFLAQKMWRRKGWVSCAAKNPFAVLFMSAAFLLSIAAGGARPLYFLLSAACAFCLLLALFNWQIISEKKERFLPVFIRSAKRMGALSVQSVRRSAFSALGIFALFILLLLGSDLVPSSSEKGLFFPAPTEYNEGERDFPNLDDYYAVKWNALAAPYRTLNKKSSEIPAEGDKVEMVHYTKTPDGIKSQTEFVRSYDKAFRKEALAQLDLFERAPVEKLWKAQGKRFSVRYTSGGGENAGFGVAAALILAMLPSLFAALYYIFALKRGKYVS